MHVLLVGAELEENLAVRYLAAALEARGHEATLATFDNPGHAAQVVAQALRSRPELVGMSMTFQFRAKEFGALAKALRDAGYRGHITVGGHFPTFAHREVLASFPSIDSVVRHEGELTLPELCSSIERRSALAGIPGLVFRAADGAIVVNEPRPMVEDLDALPFPKRVGEPQLHLGIPAAFMVGTRGCFGHCTFCCIHAYLKSAGGPMYRMRSPENVADEMAELRQKRGARMFVFHDDDFFTRDAPHDLARAIALRDALRARSVNDVALVVKARPDDVDPQVFSVLQDIGLLRVYLGIEAGSTQGLKTLGRGVDIAANRRALARLRERDVYTCFNMLVFDPESRLESLRESFRFLRDYPMVPMNFCRTEIYVGTPLMTKLEREERLRGDVFGWDYAISDPRAERAFRVFASAFLDRNFRCDGLMNATLGLGYHLHLLRQFYPGAMTSELRDLADETTKCVNLDCVTRMEAILDFAGSSAAEDRSALEAFTHRTTREVEAANRSLEDQVSSATGEIIRAALSPRSKPRAVPRWQALSAAAATLALGACERFIQPPPPDPLPVPTLVGPPDASPMPPPPDPLPPPMVNDPPPAPIIDAGSGVAVPVQPDAGRFATPPSTVHRRPPSPADPPPPPNVLPMPPDPVPRPNLLPPPDPPPPPHIKK